MSTPVQAVAKRKTTRKPWMLPVAMLLSGLTGWAILDSSFDQRRLAIGKTEAVAARFQSSAMTMNSEAVLAAYGNAGSIDRMVQQRNMLQTDLTLLQRGGRLSADDTINVMALDGVAGVPLPAVSEKLAAFDRSTEPMLGAAEVLRRAAEAETNLPQTIASLKATAAELAKVKALNTGAWASALTPVRQDLTRREMPSMPLVFAPIDQGQALAKQWADLFASRAVDAQAMANIAASDKTLSSRDKALLDQFAADAVRLSEQTRILYSSNDQRLAARRALGDIRAAATDLQASTDAFMAAVRKMSSGDRWTQFAVWVLAALAIAGLFMTLKALWTLAFENQRMVSDSQAHTELSQAMTRMATDLKRILGRDTNSVRLAEQTGAPTFALTSLINQTLAQRDNANAVIEEQSRFMQKGLFDMEGQAILLNAALVQHRQVVSGLSSQSDTVAHALAEAGDVLDGISAGLQAALDVSRRGGAMAQENAWQMEALRENTQGTSKRIKRLGESAQGISASTDLIRDITRRIKVLAINVAIEAAAQGEQGQNFMLLTNELERLTDNAAQAVADIDTQVVAIQTDAKETVASMEEGTATVVGSGKLSAQSLAMFRDLDRTVERLREQSAQTTTRVQETALLAAEEASAASGAQSTLIKQDEYLGQIRSRSEVFRQAIEEFRKWLAGSGRDL